jgi:hypothetical protein
MIIYKNIGLDNTQKKRKKEKRINTFGDVCWFFRSFKLEKFVSDPYLLYLANKNMLKLKQRDNVHKDFSTSVRELLFI